MLDIQENGMHLAILDTSATCHMPDVLEMPYRPMIIGSGQANELAHTYRLGGLTCLAGDVIGDYSFEQPLKPKRSSCIHRYGSLFNGENHMFNGVNLPSIVSYNDEEGIKVIREFKFEDYSGRLS